MGNIKLMKKNIFLKKFKKIKVFFFFENEKK